MVNEEKTEYLNLLAKQLTFTLQVGADGLTNLNTTQVIFVDSTHGITLMQNQTIDKTGGKDYSIGVTIWMIPQKIRAVRSPFSRQLAGRGYFLRDGSPIG